MQITIITPTYNRAHLLPSLYESLKIQKCPNLIWLVVDDGSTDDTEAVIQEFQKEAKITIEYLKQKNQGKHIAFNTGIKRTKTPLVLNIDSDDQMMEGAIHYIKTLLPEFLENKNIAAIAFPRFSEAKNSVKTNKAIPFSKTIISSIDLVHHYQLSGEFEYLFKTEIVKQFPFPQFNNEKFIKESLILKRIDKIYNYLYVKKPIVKGEYLEDGLSTDFRGLLEKNPKGSALAYLEITNDPRFTFSERKEAFKNYWYFENISKQHSKLQRLMRVKKKDVIFSFIYGKLFNS